MKIKRYAMMLAATTGLFAACQDLDEMHTYAPEDVVAPVLHNLPEEIVITSENMARPRFSRGMPPISASPHRSTTRSRPPAARATP